MKNCSFVNGSGMAVDFTSSHREQVRCQRRAERIRPQVGERRLSHRRGMPKIRRAFGNFPTGPAGSSAPHGASRPLRLGKVCALQIESHEVHREDLARRMK